MATIAENLSRIQSAKTDIKTAIEAKGVTVPSSATIDTYATYVSQISGGGAATPSNLSDWTYDSFGKITSAVIRNGVTSINSEAFYSCYYLSAVTIPDSVTSIGNLAFYRCFSYNLDLSITIPDSVITIGGNAFRECINLEDVTIGSGITSIGDYAFSGCTNLTRITINATTPPNVNSGIFAETPIENGNGHIYVPEESVDLYKASSGFSAYSDCITCIGCVSSTCSEKLCGIDDTGNEFTIHDDGTDSLTQNDNISSFNLVEATVGNIISTIDERAFENCNQLTAVTIPDSVTSIGNNAFERCRNLQSVTVLATMPPMLNDMAFRNTPIEDGNGWIYVPEESLMEYQHQWNNYESQIQAIPT